MSKNKSSAVGALVGGLLAMAGAFFGLDASPEESAAVAAGAAALCAVIVRRLAK